MWRRLLRWLWSRLFDRSPWGRLAYGLVAMGIGIAGLEKGEYPTVYYLWLASGSLSLGIGVTAWVYRLRHRLPSEEAWLDRWMSGR